MLYSGFRASLHGHPQKLVVSVSVGGGGASGISSSKISFWWPDSYSNQIVEIGMLRILARKKQNYQVCTWLSSATNFESNVSSPRRISIIQSFSSPRNSGNMNCIGNSYGRRRSGRSRYWGLSESTAVFARGDRFSLRIVTPRIGF